MGAAVVGINSCIGVSACDGSAFALGGSLGDGSCIGEIACLFGFPNGGHTVGAGSCIGESSCEESEALSIGDRSVGIMENFSGLNPQLMSPCWLFLWFLHL
jgi:hypothetical protein